MKIITKSLLLFAALVFIYTLLFRFGLSYLLEAEKYGFVLIISLLYSVLMFFTGWLTGRRDGRKYFRFDAGFRWNLTTYLVYHLVSLPWFWLGLNSQKENIVNGVYVAAMIWTTLLLIHLVIFLLVMRRTIKGIHKSEIFE